MPRAGIILAVHRFKNSNCAFSLSSRETRNSLGRNEKREK